MKRKSSYPGSSNKRARRSASSRPPVVYNRHPVETKYFDTSFSQNIASAADWTGTEVPCTNYVQSDGTTVGTYTDSALIPSAVGSGYGQVNGSKYYLKKLRVRGNIAPAAVSDQADVPVGRTVRVLLVHDTQPNGAQAQGEDLFIDMGGAVQNIFNFMSMGSGSGGRYRVLSDETLILDTTASGTDGVNTQTVGFQNKNFSFVYSPKKPIQVNIKSNSATPTVVSLANQNLFLLAHSSGGATTIQGCARAYYTD